LEKENNLIFREGCQVVNNGYKNAFIELEIPGNDDPQIQANRRIAFYKRKGVNLTNIKYKLPLGEGTPMFLAYKSVDDVPPTKETIYGVIKKIMENIHSDQKNMPAIRDEVLSQIINAH